MAIQLYRKGTTHTVNGIECELCNFAISSLQSMLDNGWHVSPKEAQDEYSQIQETQGDDEGQEEGSTQEESKDEDKILNPIRVLAREKNIEGWDTKRIQTLQGLIDEHKD